VADLSTARPPITHVAVRLFAVVWSLPRPYRHHHILNEILPKYAPQLYVEVDADDKDQGFLDADGRFLTRKQALNNAVANGQIKNGKLIGSILTSEDLW
jgi:hypothetical protein